MAGTMRDPEDTLQSLGRYGRFHEMVLGKTSTSILGRRRVGMRELVMRIGADAARLLHAEEEEATLDKTTSLRKRMAVVTPQLHPAGLRHQSILAECRR